MLFLPMSRPCSHTLCWLMVSSVVTVPTLGRGLCSTLRMNGSFTVIPLSAFSLLVQTRNHTPEGSYQAPYSILDN